MDVAAAAGAGAARRASLVLGAGGIGSWLALSLAMMGVAELIVVDPDVVEDRNRTRQPYAVRFGRAPEGRGARRDRDGPPPRPPLRRRRSPRRARATISARSSQDVDVVACCADEPSLDVDRRRSSRASACRRGCRTSSAATTGRPGASGPFWYPRRRAAPVPRLPLAVVSPTTGLRTRRASSPSATQAANACQRLRSRSSSPAVAASEILHFRAGVRPATAGKLFSLDSLTLGSSRSRVPLRSDCPICFGGRKRHVAVSSSADALARERR